MPHGSVTKNDILARVYKMKNELYDGDLLTVPDISDTLKFKVNIHNNLDKNKLRYIPYVK